MSSASATFEIQPVYRRVRPATIALWSLRALILVPFVLMGPELVAAVRAQPDSIEHLSASTADVLGTSSFMLFILMLTISPIHTVTGWRWHLPLRRDFGLGMFAVAMIDFFLAATTTGDSFEGGLLARIGGHSFLAAGTLATFLLIPLALTANRRAKHWLGKHWRWLHRLTYLVWATIMLHLFLLFALRSFFVSAMIVSVPLIVLRVPPVRARWSGSRRAHTHRFARAAMALILGAVFVVGYAPFVRELAGTGVAAFHQAPVDD